jgi:hypothetical protein
MFVKKTAIPVYLEIEWAHFWAGTVERIWHMLLRFSAANDDFRF